ncbi:ankyrin [Pseudomonas flavescens]|uniref:Ankyrin n=1 Tax=Phytopseudomonas flavescens TaxID=29435 RepID=A0A1G8A8S6_9GAMM|nr:ankyrin repeat domain-containing protein [Pseudomonas flavescens]SDH17362.1 ankyrin [Pseudomonas flavescens]
MPTAARHSLHIACHAQDSALLVQLLATATPAAIDKKLTDYQLPYHGTPLHIASRMGDLGLVQPLIAAGADLEIKDVARQSALSLAAGLGHQDVVQALLDAGADPHSKGPNGLQPIHFACTGGHPRIIALLLAHGVDVNLRDSLKSGLLSFTTNLEGGHLEAAQMLVAQGIDPIQYTQALHDACWRGNTRIAAYLLELGADVQSLIKPKSELLFWVCLMGHEQIIDLLLAHGADFSVAVKFKGKMMAYDGSPLDKAAEAGHTALAERLCARAIQL